MRDRRVHPRDDLASLISQMAGWDAGPGPTPGMHVGDLGWALRDPEPAPVHAWWSGDRLDAVALVEGPMARVRVAPDLTDDDELASAVGQVCTDLQGDEVWADVAPGTALDRHLRDAGWGGDGDPWACLHRQLGDDPVTDEPADLARDCVVDRVAVQRAGFENSSFTEEKWRLMSTGPGYVPELDVVVRTADGQAAAVATAWLSVPGGTAILEPVATHRDHRAQGHGRRAVHAATEAARRQGASGITVFTPLSNSAAVAAYQGSGFTQVATNESLTRVRKA